MANTNGTPSVTSARGTRRSSWMVITTTFALDTASGNLDILLPYVPFPIRGASLTVNATTASNGSATVTLDPDSAPYGGGKLITTGSITTTSAICVVASPGPSVGTNNGMLAVVPGGNLRLRIASSSNACSGTIQVALELVN